MAALVVGVLAMHGAPAPCQAHAASPPDAHVAAMSVADEGQREDDRGHDPCAVHHLLTLCLAILIAAALLATAVWRVLRAWTKPDGRSPLTAAAARVGDRAAPPTAVRLAQLCVSRR